jgi:hypothetical protein
MWVCRYSMRVFVITVEFFSSIDESSSFDPKWHWPLTETIARSVGSQRGNIVVASNPTFYLLSFDHSQVKTLFLLVMHTFPYTIPSSRRRFAFLSLSLSLSLCVSLAFFIILLSNSEDESVHHLRLRCVKNFSYPTVHTLDFLSTVSKSSPTALDHTINCASCILGYDPFDT